MIYDMAAPRRRPNGAAYPPDTSTHRFCSFKQHWAPLDKFGRTPPRHPGGVGRLHRRCTPCANEYSTARRANLTPEQRWRRDRDANLRRNFSITLVQYEQMVEGQGGVCAIPGCEVDITGLDERGCSAPVDHCHGSGRVRKVLCWGCNSGLGMFRDDPVKLRGAASYLEEHRVAHLSVAC